MTHSDYNHMFRCPRCGAVGAIYVLKIGGDKIVIKQRCPKHGGRSFKVPLMHMNQFSHLIRDSVFRCYKCGQEAVATFEKKSGPYSLIKCTCPTHGKQTVQKIWKTVYDEISKKEIVEPKPEEPELKEPEPAEEEPVESELEEPEPTPSEKTKICPMCKSPLRGIEKFCGTCGTEIED